MSEVSPVSRYERTPEERVRLQITNLALRLGRLATEYHELTGQRLVLSSRQVLEDEQWYTYIQVKET